MVADVRGVLFCLSPNRFDFQLLLHTELQRLIQPLHPSFTLLFPPARRLRFAFSHRLRGAGQRKNREHHHRPTRSIVFHVDAFEDASPRAPLHHTPASLPHPPFLRTVPLMIEVSGFTKRYGRFTAVEDLSFAVHPGEVLGLVGPNGAGKTTTLRCLAGIIPATSGSIHIAGHDLAVDPIAAKRALAFFPDEPRLFDYLTVRQHLAFVAKIYGVADHASRADALLTELELAEKADELPTALSRGMKQKLAIACGLLHSPTVMFFDEPLTGLDPLGIRLMKDSILQRARAGATIILSSHLLHLLEEVCSHVLILKRGQKIAAGPLHEIVSHFSNGDATVSLEEVFLRATGGSES